MYDRRPRALSDAGSESAKTRIRVRFAKLSPARRRDMNTLMQYTNLGRTGLKVSRLCLGTMNYGPQASEEEGHAQMDKALELGFNFFDTANVYGWKKGEGVTEQIVGRWFAKGNGRREKVVIATKVYGAMGDWPNETYWW